ncbi:putative membrane protein [Alkalibacillus flavidus]|uniref:Membrane protein n=1 Tax=Alkalibacillus flavidus TaxID=546021 RepID=A0ABV2KWB7_9BACI
MFTVLIISIVIIIVVAVLTVMAISKGYSYEHTVDPLPEEEGQDKDNAEEDNGN